MALLTPDQKAQLKALRKEWKATHDTGSTTTPNTATNTTTTPPTPAPTVNGTVTPLPGVPVH